MNIWLIIPVNSLKESKSRLADLLTENQRRELTGHLLSHLIEVGRQVNQIQRISVATPDPEVELLVGSQPVTIILEEGRRGLNSALAQGRDVAAENSDCILILPCDLPFISKRDIEILLAPLADRTNTDSPGAQNNKGQMVICPNLDGDGTNALLLCKAGDFTFRFGQNSFQKHLFEADIRGLTTHIVDPEGIKFDLDSEEDWRDFLRRTSGLPVPGFLE